MRIQTWLSMVAGALALLCNGMALAQPASPTNVHTPEMKILTQFEAGNWKARVAAGYIGVGLTFDKQIILVGDRGLFVQEIAEGSTAEDTGVRLNDVIVAINATPVASLAIDKVQDLMRGVDGQKTTFTLVRAGEQSDVTVVHDLDGQLGITLGIIDPVLYPLITQVRSDSSAAQAGLLEGDRLLAVNGSGTANTSPSTVSAWFLGSLDSAIIVKVERAGQQHTVTLKRGVLVGPSVGHEFQHGIRLR